MYSNVRFIRIQRYKSIGVRNGVTLGAPQCYNYALYGHLMKKPNASTATRYLGFLAIIEDKQATPISGVNLGETDFSKPKHYAGRGVWHLEIVDHMEGRCFILARLVCF